MERTDWLNEGFDPAQARFLMVTAITHHRFSSPMWGKDEVEKLHAELAGIDMTAAQAAIETPQAEPRVGRSFIEGVRAGALWLLGDEIDR